MRIYSPSDLVARKIAGLSKRPIAFLTQTPVRISHLMQYRGELNVAAVSSNYELYGDMSRRVMNRRKLQ